MKKFTVITDVFYKLDIFKHTAEAILNQTYKNLEIIIIDNGASDEIKKYINDLKNADNRIKIIHHKENVFDFIWCNGVLHHTKDPYGAFKILIKSLKNQGYVLVGLYNKFGRLRTVIRRYLYKIFGRKLLEKIDPTLRNLKLDDDEKNAWIRDQYIHPIESLHTIDEVLLWFKKNNIEFISSVPSADFDYDYNDIFNSKSKGTFLTRIFNQFLMIFNSLGSDGGLFVLIGKKNNIDNK